MREVPILLTPACAVPAFRHGEREWMIDGTTVGYLDAMRYTQWFNVLAAPAAVVPVGRSPEGMPIGVQVAGRPFEDEKVLAVATAIEHGFGYRPPPLAVG
jgi:Asp-tRNA(Asn)/Glu-tRNA(Gln) amidotransferase A subunit family amidase